MEEGKSVPVGVWPHLQVNQNFNIPTVSFTLDGNYTKLKRKYGLPPILADKAALVGKVQERLQSELEDPQLRVVRVAHGSIRVFVEGNANQARHWATEPIYSYSS